ncbi:GNAT family N-acetyltransferase [Peribacillus sp. SCS-37]|uniref:GNAT family N-acetyltransferase n=1 Tax=Paraperibacillus esterisolvens TaxID=3115296 RepID=UPI00390661C2
MIRQLSDRDHEAVSVLLRQEPAFNLFIIGDIEAFGYSAPFQDIWGEFSANNELISVLLRFHDSYIIYGPASLDAAGFAELLPKDKPLSISGKSETVALFEGIDCLQLGNKKEMYFAESSELPREVLTQSGKIKEAGLVDVDKIMELRRAIQEFDADEASRKLLTQSMKYKTGRTFYFEEDGRIIASASTAAENSMSAMIMGVCTHPSFRNRGYATQILKQLIAEFVVQQSKTLCLFYDNPEAGRIYRRLGFREIGKWTIYR